MATEASKYYRAYCWKISGSTLEQQKEFRVQNMTEYWFEELGLNSIILWYAYGKHFLMPIFLLGICEGLWENRPT